MDYKTGERVYMLLVHAETQEERKRFGTVVNDQIEGWDYVDVAFDDWPNLPQPVLCYYLYREQTDN